MRVGTLTLVALHVVAGGIATHERDWGWAAFFFGSAAMWCADDLIDAIRELKK